MTAEATAEVQATYRLHGANAATRLAADYLAHGDLTVGGYLDLVKWSEGRGPLMAAHPACPDCGTAGQPDSRAGTFAHIHTPGTCRVYTWDTDGRIVARDIHTRAERDARADAVDARLRRLNPFVKR